MSPDWKITKPVNRLYCIVSEHKKCQCSVTSDCCSLSGSLCQVHHILSQTPECELCMHSVQIFKNGPNDAGIPCQSSLSHLEKGPQLHEQMSQHTTVGYDYRSLEVRALQSLVLNIKD